METTAIPRVDRLDLKRLPRGHISRLRVDIAEDVLGRPLSVPVLVARGDRPGPVFGLTAAVHGNELNGIPVIHRLFEQINPRNLRGSLVAVVVVNLPGFLRRKRSHSDGRDLNHLWPGKAIGHPAEVYAHRIMNRIIGQLDYLCDLHTASRGRINSLYVRADMTDRRTAAMAYLQRPEIILHNPASDGTLRGAASALGIPAITLEIGNPQLIQGDYVRRSLLGVRAMLGLTGLLPRRKVSEGPVPILCDSSTWLHADHGGLLRVLPRLTDRVAQGDAVATLTSMFGDHVATYVAPMDGFVIGRSVDPAADTGARIVHLGRIAGPGGVALVDRHTASAEWEVTK